MEDIKQLGDEILKAVSYNQQNQLELLLQQLKLQKNLNINTLYDAGWLPLHQAANNPTENIEIVKMLLDAGANVNALTGNQEHSALSLACGNNHVDIVKLLLKRGADPNQKRAYSVRDRLQFTSETHTLLYDTVFNHHQKGSRAPDLVELLLSYNADPNVLCIGGRTSALHLAIERRYSDIIEKLCSFPHLLNIELKTSQFDTPLEYLVAKIYWEIKTPKKFQNPLKLEKYFECMDILVLKGRCKVDYNRLRLKIQYLAPEIQTRIEDHIKEKVQQRGELVEQKDHSVRQNDYQQQNNPSKTSLTDRLRGAFSRK